MKWRVFLLGLGFAAACSGQTIFVAGDSTAANYQQSRAPMTGWAQVNGYRGDTSIYKRIEHDLYYIENWTLGLDIKIIILTFFKGFINKNAY